MNKKTLYKNKQNTKNNIFTYIKDFFNVTVKNYLFYAGATKEEFESIEIDIVTSNKNTTSIFSLVGVILISTMLCCSFIFEPFRKLQNVYIAGVALSAIILFLSRVLSYKNTFFSYLAVYISISVFLVYGISISITKPDQQTVTFMVMMMLLAVIFIDKPIRMGGTLLFYILLFIFLAYKTKNKEVCEVDIIDAGIFGTLAIASCFVVISVKVRGFIMRNQLKVLSETDVLTGLNNRTCYEMNLYLYSKEAKTLGCIYLDLNGLHAINNNKGHKAGDIMLQNFANLLKECFAKENIYRIGGDEFVVLIADKDESYLTENMELLIKAVKEKNFYVASGWSFQLDKINIHDLVLDAEKKMYEDKKIYYQTHTR